MDVKDLVDISKSVSDKFRTEIWWRGQSLSKWDLVPGVYRKDGGHNYEKNISARFLQRALTRHPKCPSEGNWPDWLFFMQHYRLPTRLLDWTESILIATYFAVCEYDAEPGAIYAISPFLLNKHQMNYHYIFSVGNKTAYPFFLPPFKGDAPETPNIIAIMAKEIDIRMMVQHSQFTIHGTNVPLNNLEDANKYIVKIEIPAKDKIDIKTQLFQLGIRESNLFPDLDHLAKELSCFKFESIE